jgi:hypothetical protein
MSTPGRKADGTTNRSTKRRADTRPPFTERDIEQRAYGLWQSDGGKRSETDYWHEARRQLERESGFESESTPPSVS